MGLKKEMQGETDRTKGHLRGFLKIQCSGSFLKYVKAILIMEQRI